MRIVALFSLSLAAAAACTSEPEQRLPVKSTTDRGVSTAPASKEAARKEESLVRFIQAVPDVTSVDVYANDMRIFTGITYGNVTPFREIPKDSYKFRIRPAGQEMAVPIADESEHVSAGYHYTVVAFREKDQGKASIKVFSDQLNPPTGGTAMIRVINASADAGDLDLYTPGSSKPALKSVDYKEDSGYVELQPMTGHIDVHRKGEETTLIELPISTYSAGRVYTIVLIGWSKSSPPSLRGVLVEDRFGS